MSVSTGRLALFVGCLVPRLSYCVPGSSAATNIQIKNTRHTHTHLAIAAACAVGMEINEYYAETTPAAAEEKWFAIFLRHYFNAKHGIF
jgi:hypothetical protein